MIVRWRKNQEYLVIRLYQDLVGDWVVSQSRGTVLSCSRQECERTILPSYQEARSMVLSLSREQRKQGFKKTASDEEQLSLRFD